MNELFSFESIVYGITFITLLIYCQVLSYRVNRLNDKINDDLLMMISKLAVRIINLENKKESDNV
jgi:hypothetical protein